MRNAVAKKIRQQARRRRVPVRRELRWWARPLVFKTFAAVGTALVRGLVALGWKAPGQWWLTFLPSIARRGHRLIVAE